MNDCTDGHEFKWTHDGDNRVFGRCKNCNDAALPREILAILNATEKLKPIYESIDDYLAPVVVKGTTKDEYIPVEASSLAWWMDAIEECLTPSG